jgi:hypothetical protein
MNITGATQGDTGSWDFGFVQIAKAKCMEFYYAGRMASEGAISCRVHIPPALQSPIVLDSEASRSPWTVSAPRFNSSGSAIHATTGDHPAAKVPFKLRNVKRNADNYLYHVIDEREFWSVFTAVDPNNRRIYLAHCHWVQRHNQKFLWRNYAPQKGANNSTFSFVDRDVKGAPTAQELQGILNNPTGGDIFNEVADRAMVQALLGPTGPNRTELDVWFPGCGNPYFFE